jgi:hypothetical protein
METVATSPSLASLRMRRARKRRRQGDAIVSIELGRGAIADLVALGWLSAANRDDKAALIRALTALIERGIQTRVTPQTGSHDEFGFMCTLRPATVETLTAFGWLSVDQQDEAESIVTAFRRFAGRALDVARNRGHDRWYIP